MFLLVLDSNGRGHLVAACIMPSESNAAVLAAFSNLKALLQLQYPFDDVLDDVRCVVSDGAPAMENAVRDFMPRARHLLCLYHLKQNVKKHVGDGPPVRRLASKAAGARPPPRISDLFFQMATRCTSVADFRTREAEINSAIDARMSESAAVRARIYMQVNIFAKAERWCRYLVDSVITLGNRTTNRLESFHRHFKGSQLRTFGVVDVANALLDFQERTFVNCLAMLDQAGRGSPSAVDETRLIGSLRAFLAPKPFERVLEEAGQTALLTISHTSTDHGGDFDRVTFRVCRSVDGRQDFYDASWSGPKPASKLREADTMFGCSCGFIGTFDLPCRHLLFALHDYFGDNGPPGQLRGSQTHRWSIEYYRQLLSQTLPPGRSALHRSSPLSSEHAPPAPETDSSPAKAELTVKPFGTLGGVPDTVQAMVDHILKDTANLASHHQQAVARELFKWWQRRGPALCADSNEPAIKAGRPGNVKRGLGYADFARAAARKSDRKWRKVNDCSPPGQDMIDDTADVHVQSKRRRKRNERAGPRKRPRATTKPASPSLTPTSPTTQPDCGRAFDDGGQSTISSDVAVESTSSFRDRCVAQHLSIQETLGPFVAGKRTWSVCYAGR